MQGIQPGSLSDDELERYCYLQLYKGAALPHDWAMALLKRFAELQDKLAARIGK